MRDLVSDLLTANSKHLVMTLFSGFCKLMILGKNLGILVCLYGKNISLFSRSLSTTGCTLGNKINISVNQQILSKLKTLSYNIFLKK